MGSPTVDPVTQEIIAFLRESNRIENIQLQSNMLLMYWEKLSERVTSEPERLARNSCRALAAAISRHKSPLTLDLLFYLHRLQMESLLPPGAQGMFRSVRVRASGHLCPDPSDVPGLMARFLKLYNEQQWDAMRLHLEFEGIHPFLDGNGRVGRLLYAMDLLRRGQSIAPILDCFGARGENIYEKRDRYFAAVQFHKGSMEALVKQATEARREE